MIAIGTPPNIGLKSKGYRLALTQSHHVCVADYGFCSLAVADARSRIADIGSTE